ncbi:MAG: exodeoxyribonuclease VII small subunit [Coriobacteriaceae bacterium]|uniref:exodeoxyribonuclease VII small subunit n=1 Tax=Tractidigestivibacter sp. TaxID=2847320 RepID=UPI002A917289|nr:exodeoxyribonuclease VII small subunit [Tractidigestivibacter sp.]MCI6548694.1 exodeoxyribonuclease VII small subunit [Coriobacteriaceae bacterium]MCI6844856.1 exodeoxyribonuclease VII small subunit [Coriobacteriaceae bacterium]MDD7585093.1 exodeoxyribonuclease VII small subunit [Coriobacteriaceae bacterium]MDY5271587.1 exodeoxyribonuclease VII small subunit [Tractidigestivibacter sp.]
MAKPDVSQYQSFDQITRRLDDIVGAVRDRDVSLERSLDLFDEAIALGSKAVELVDATDFSPEEKAMLADEGAPGEGGAEKPPADAATADAGGVEGSEGDSAPAGDATAAEGAAEGPEGAAGGGSAS